MIAKCSYLQHGAKVENLLDIQGLAEFLQVSKRKLEQMIDANEAPPFIRFGRLRRWEPAEVRAWLVSKREAESKDEKNR